MIETALIFLWVLASLLVGYLGCARRIGFWGFFIVSLCMSPLIGLLVPLLGAPGKQTHSL